MFAFRSDPDVARYQGWKPRSIEEAHQFIQGLSGVEPDTPGTWFQLALVHRVRGELIGDCGLHFLAAPEGQVEIGITLARSHQGQGYATETMEGLLAYLFDQLGKHRVIASVDPRNHPALKLFQRSGLRKEAHFVESLWMDGAWVDDVIFALLAREDRSRHTSFDILEAAYFSI